MDGSHNNKEGIPLESESYRRYEICRVSETAFFTA